MKRLLVLLLLLPFLVGWGRSPDGTDSISKLEPGGNNRMAYEQSKAFSWDMTLEGLEGMVGG